MYPRHSTFEERRRAFDSIVEVSDEERVLTAEFLPAVKEAVMEVMVAVNYQRSPDVFSSRWQGGDLAMLSSRSAENINQIAWASQVDTYGITSPPLTRPANLIFTINITILLVRPRFALLGGAFAVNYF